MGGNGSGKTTLGLLLCGILKPDSGQIIIDNPGSDQYGNQPVIGFLFQDPDNGLVATTVEREVAFALENRNTPLAEMRPVVEQTLTLFGMDDYRDQLVWNLSGGEKQRLSLAGLFASGPNILFLDEPVSYLDFEGAGQLEEALSTVKEADPSITIIRVTQFPTIAENHLRVLVIGNGRVLADDSPQNIFKNRDLMIKAGLRPPLKYLTPRENEGPSESTDDIAIGPDTTLNIQNICFKYDSSNAPHLIDNLSLTVRRGEVVALVGPSGSGKSTLAQLICGIYEPTRGKIVFDNDDARAVMSFQQPEKQFFLDTAYDEIAFGIRKDYPDPVKLAGAVRRSMESAGLDYDEFKDRDPHSLSGGEARRLGFAIVMAIKADLIIFDEPTCALDNPGLNSFKHQVGNLKRDGKTVMIITHNSDIIGDLADRVARLSGGRIISLTDPFSFFSGTNYQAMLSMPEVSQYQIMRSGTFKTVRAQDIFDLDQV